MHENSSADASDSSGAATRAQRTNSSKVPAFEDASKTATQNDPFNDSSDSSVSVQDVPASVRKNDDSLFETSDEEDYDHNSKRDVDPPPADERDLFASSDDESEIPPNVTARGIVTERDDVCDESVTAQGIVTTPGDSVITRRDNPATISRIPLVNQLACFASDSARATARHKKTEHLFYVLPLYSYQDYSTHTVKPNTVYQ